MSAGGDDRLSELPDDLLRRVLHFTPLKEAASTTALSRRWRAPLWLSSGAVNLETGVEKYCDDRSRHGKARFFSRHDDFVTAASGALDAADVPVTRVTLRLEFDFHEPEIMSWYHRHERDKVISRFTDLVDVVLSHRAARRMEELRLDAKDPLAYIYDYNRGPLYKVALDSLPLETLRVLELTNCKGLHFERWTALGATAVPCLSSLRLSHCRQRLSSLQRVIDAAPALAAIRLEYVVIYTTRKENTPPVEATKCCLRCPAATLLVLDNCTWEERTRGRGPCGNHYRRTAYVVPLDIDATRLRRFRYKGLLNPISFSPQLLELEQLDLEFFNRVYKVNKEDRNRDLEKFWRFARNFTNTKEMRLRVNHLEDIAVLSEARHVELLPTFRRLECLEIQGAHWTKDKTAAVMTILNLLRCCPVLCALRMNLTAEHENASNKEGVSTRVPQKEIQIAAMLGPRRSCQCLRSSLGRVGLQFRLEKSDCLGIKLIKFFAENARVLEEMHIDDGGDENLCEQMYPKTEKWNLRRKMLGVTSFVVLPLKRG